MVQAALTGQGVVLARLPLVAESLANGDLIEPLPKLRMDSPMAYWLIIGPAQRAAAGDPRLLRLADGAEPHHAADDRRSAGPGHGRRHRLNQSSSSDIGQTTPSSFRMASSATSCGSTSKSCRKPCAKPSPTVNGLGCS